MKKSRLFVTLLVMLVAASGFAQDSYRETLKEYIQLYGIEVDTKTIAQGYKMATSYLFKSGDVNKEYRDMMQQLTTYSMMGKNKHDDVPDCLAMFVDWQLTDRSNIATIVKRRF